MEVIFNEPAVVDPESNNWMSTTELNMELFKPLLYRSSGYFGNKKYIKNGRIIGCQQLNSAWSY